MTDTTVPVIVPCACPGTPHGDGDTVFIDADLGPAAGIAAVAMATAEDPMTFAQRYGLMIETAVQLSVRDWTRQHEVKNGTGTKLEKVPISPETVRQQLTWDKGGAEISIEAMKRYGDTLGVPFGRAKARPAKGSSSSPTGPTDGPSISPTPRTRKRRPKPSA